jgi:hypothetical protein
MLIKKENNNISYNYDFLEENCNYNKINNDDNFLWFEEIDGTVKKIEINIFKN